MRSEAISVTNKFRLAVSDYWLARYDAGEGFARGDAWSLGLFAWPKTNGLSTQPVNRA